MIILEGCDGAGKTTLARKLEQHYELRYHKFSDPPRSRAMILDRAGELREMGVRVLADRHPFISELIYGPVLRNECQMGPRSLEWLGRLLADEPFIIHVNPPYRAVRYGLQSREHLQGVEKHTHTLYQRYISLFTILKDLTVGRGRVVTYNRELEFSGAALDVALTNYLKPVEVQENP